MEFKETLLSSVQRDVTLKYSLSVDHDSDIIKDETNYISAV